jgi:hypothetical protein
LRGLVLDLLHRLVGRAVLGFLRLQFLELLGDFLRLAFQDFRRGMRGQVLVAAQEFALGVFPGGIGEIIVLGVGDRQLRNLVARLREDAARAFQPFWIIENRIGILEQNGAFREIKIRGAFGHHRLDGGAFLDRGIGDAFLHEGRKHRQIIGIDLDLLGIRRQRHHDHAQAESRRGIEILTRHGFSWCFTLPIRGRHRALERPAPRPASGPGDWHAVRAMRIFGHDPSSGRLT